MKMKKLIKCIDYLTQVSIFTPDSGDEDPDWEGYLLDMPWYYLDYIVGREDGDEPIYIYTDDNGKPRMVINLIPED